jgi:hypothetical protein
MTQTMPELPDHAYALAGHDGAVQFLYQRDDESAKAGDWDNERWFDVSDDDASPITWDQVCADEDGEPCPVVRLYRADEPAITVTGQGSATSVVTIDRPDEDRIEVHVNGQVVATANHDEHGWSGMDAVEKTALAVARAFGGTVAR